MEMRNIDEILQSFRYDLPADSKTALAIDRRAPLTEISECAEEEGIHELSSVLFEAQQEELIDADDPDDTDVGTTTAAFIRNFRKGLPKASKTAAAIDRGATWEEISECAQEEGLHELATVLFESEQERLRQG